MNVIRTVAELRAELLEPRRAGRRIGLVPTMGAFHDGHLSLMRRARQDCDVVVVSLFVNPTQFNDADRPRRLPARSRARRRARRGDRRRLPVRARRSRRSIRRASRRPCRSPGSPRRSRAPTAAARTSTAVATVVTKLFNMVGPDVAYFGQKDAQQAIVIRRFVRDLDIPVAIEVCPTVREADGLAMSSRNVHLSPADRARAAALHRALSAARDAVSAGERDPGAARERALAELARAGSSPSTSSSSPPTRLAPLERIDGDALAVLAAPVGGTRLIDNELIQPPNGTGGPECNADAQHRPRGGDPPRGANRRVRSEGTCPQHRASRSRRTSTPRCR